MSGAPIAAEQVLADAFGHMVRRWAEEQGASAGDGARVAEAARWVSRATSAGHVCLRLQALAESSRAARAEPDAEQTDRGDGGALGQDLDVPGWRASLRASHLVGSPDAPGALPLILDEEDRLYLHRYFDYEVRLARRLERMLAPPADGGGGGDGEGGRAAQIPRNVAALLKGLFGPREAARDGTADWQQIAVVTALLGRLTLISGGPGTGKTTAVVNLLACLLTGDPRCRIALAAPTGKAAARITETIRGRTTHLTGELAALLPQESFTIHRLLGVLPNGGFRHQADNPLPFDVVVVDEASMLDLALATHLFEALPDHARVILLGDKDQLAAVESGAVFAELSAHPQWSEARVQALARICEVSPGAIRRVETEGDGARTPSPLTDSVVWLTRNYRFAGDSPIGRLAALINAGAAAGALECLRARTDPALSWLDDGAGADAALTFAENAIGDLYGEYLAAVRAAAPDPAAIARAFGRCRILCAVREGLRGTRTINELVGRAFRRALDHPLDPGPQSDWYPGRPVIVLRNDYVLKLFNGDIGIVLPDADGELAVYFPDPDAGLRSVAPMRLPEHETAFAMTVHKSQGSEFDAVIVSLPAEKNRVLTRELLYTAVTRARERVTILGSRNIVQTTIETRTDRDSGLLSRLLRR
jgi:exodeoxyribonuclease V alpha subunit